MSGSIRLDLSGGAASLDSQGRRPLERIPTTHRESRSDGIGAPLANTANATAPPFTIPCGHEFQGLAPLGIE